MQEIINDSVAFLFKNTSMKSKKFILIATLFIGFLGLISLQDASPDDPDEENPPTRNWQQDPPNVDSMWVQQLSHHCWTAAT